MCWRIASHARQLDTSGRMARISGNSAASRSDAYVKDLPLSRVRGGRPDRLRDEREGAHARNRVPRASGRSEVSTDLGTAQRGPSGTGDRCLASSSVESLFHCRWSPGTGWAGVWPSWAGFRMRSSVPSRRFASRNRWGRHTRHRDGPPSRPGPARVSQRRAPDLILEGAAAAVVPAPRGVIPLSVEASITIRARRRLRARRRSARPRSGCAAR